MTVLSILCIHFLENSCRHDIESYRLFLRLISVRNTDIEGRQEVDCDFVQSEVVLSVLNVFEEPIVTIVVNEGSLC